MYWNKFRINKWKKQQEFTLKYLILIFCESKHKPKPETGFVLANWYRFTISTSQRFFWNLVGRYRVLMDKQPSYQLKVRLNGGGGGSYGGSLNFSFMGKLFICGLRNERGINNFSHTLRIGKGLTYRGPVIT